MTANKCLISIITTYYQGSKYVDQLCQMALENQKNLESQGIGFEYILINDSPWEETVIPEIYGELNVIVYNNERNYGIHKSRVLGLNKAQGDYVLILDQDDLIAGNYLLSQYRKIKDRDVVVCNGIKEMGDYDKVIYKDRFKMKLVNAPLIYLKAANQIVSPGQCLIKKSSIPAAWKEHPLAINGADDLFLWLLYLGQGRRFALNEEKLYIHKQVGDNLSNDLEKMCDSDKEMCALAKEYNLMPQSYIDRRLRLCAFIKDSNYTQKLNVKLLFKYFDVVFLKIFAYYL